MERCVAKKRRFFFLFKITDDQLLVSVLDLFAAGTETTTSSLLWSFIFMAQYPEVQRKVQAEIDANVGRERPIRVSDKSKPSRH